MNANETLIRQFITAWSRLDAKELASYFTEDGCYHNMPTQPVCGRENVEKLIEIEKEKGKDLKIQDIMDQVAGVYPKVMIEGQMDAGAWSCGMMVGLINDIPTCKELIDRIMADAEFIIRKRLAGFLDGTFTAATPRKKVA